MMLALAALGGAIGAGLRYLVGEYGLRWLHLPLPLSTLAINVLGSFLLGWLVGAGIERRLSTLLGVGLLGGFTTFSTFSVQTLTLLERAPMQAVGYAAASVALSVLAAAAGLALGRLA